MLSSTSAKVHVSNKRYPDCSVLVGSRDDVFVFNIHNHLRHNQTERNNNVRNNNVRNNNVRNNNVIETQNTDQSNYYFKL